MSNLNLTTRPPINANRKSIAGRAMQVFLVAMLPTVTGCMQLETHIRLNEDGSGVVTERLGFSQRLLEMAKAENPQSGLEPLLARSAAEKRAGRMGKGVAVVRHEVRDGPAGMRESITVYKVADLNGYAYLSPFVGLRGYKAVGLRFSFRPNLKYHRWNFFTAPPGYMVLHFRPEPYPATKPVGKGKKGKNNKPARSTPLDMQAYRELVPVFAGMLDDFQARVTFESYCPIIGGQGLAMRGVNARSPRVDLINVSGKENKDRYGYRFIQNEEIMVEMMTGRLDGRFWSGTLYKNLGWAWDRRPLASHMRGNSTLPLVSQRNGAEICFPPSRALYRKYVEGKTLDWTNTLNNTIKARGKRPAEFKLVGWKPKKIVTKDHGDKCPTDCPWCKPKRKR